MSDPVPDTISNQLLCALSSDDLAALRPSLEPIALPKGFVLVEAGKPCEWAYFPDAGMISVVNSNHAGRTLEMGVFGRDGMGSTAIVLGADTSPLDCYAQMDGYGHRLPAAVLRQALAERVSVQRLLLRYVQAFLVQVSQTAMSNGSYTIEERLARWLLLVHDRADGNDLSLTHEFMSIMLGVRRTGVTLAIHILEGAHMIRARRGVLTILDRSKLESTAGDGYGVAEAEYERLIGSYPGRRGTAPG